MVAGWQHHLLVNGAVCHVTVRSFVWQYFGFLIKKDKDGNRVTDKTKTVCKLCYAVTPYTTSNTTNMNHHLQRHHKNVKTAPEKTSLKKGQLTMKQALTPTLPPSSPRAKQITRLIGEFIADYMAPFNIVENRKFIQMFKVLEPKFKMPCRGHFSEKVIPEIYNETKQSVKECLKNANCIALTTDGWTSRATQSYITITAQVIDEKWESKSFVLQTCELSESHTGVNIADVLRNALREWELTRPQTTIACVTDNASNMDIAVRESGLHPHIKCLAHVVNLASKRGLAVSRVVRLLGRVRRVTFFHKSTTVTAVLANKQTQLELPRHKLITNVQTRWNSTYEMLARYLEQQAAVSAALSSPEIRRNAREIDTLDNTDISDVEDIVKLLKPLKTATTVVCDEKEPTVSLIMPLKYMIEQSMSPDENDTQTIANMKSAILLDISDRYSGDCNDMLQECTALDPRFRSLSHLNNEQRESVYARIREKAAGLHLQRNQTSDTDERTTRASASTPGAAAAEQAVVMIETAQGAEQSQEEPVEGERQMQDMTQPPPPKKTALEDLLGSSYITLETVQSSRGIEMEILSYRNGIPIPLNKRSYSSTGERYEAKSYTKRLQKELTTGPQTLIVDDGAVNKTKHIFNKNTKVLCFTNDMVSDISEKILEITAEHPTVKSVVIHTGALDVVKQQSEVLKQDFNDLLNKVRCLNTEVFISGPLPTVRRGDERFSRLLMLNRWLKDTCAAQSVNFIDNFNIFWERRHLFEADGFCLNKSGTLEQAFSRQSAYATASKKAQDLTAAISYCIAKDMMPFQMVERPGFLRVMNVAVPHYKVPSRNFFSKTEIPKMYNAVKADVRKSLAQGEFFAATTDIWTSESGAGQPYISFTIHYLTPDWQLESHCLETQFFPEDHSAQNIRVF
ncbi:Zinc finger BED domain-containing protein 1 [Merluccius polli]|uniref:Zinc finger BED domain-containing protein 1 n=1 Tax=Merluccius polli TaxID=89951 RepID=A0AA47MQI5_MERPO|nr:Zinc finger BED domain-containing protein 1 [Merluccius polli]